MLFFPTADITPLRILTLKSKSFIAALLQYDLICGPNKSEQTWLLLSRGHIAFIKPDSPIAKWLYNLDIRLRNLFWC